MGLVSTVKGKKQRGGFWFCLGITLLSSAGLLQIYAGIKGVQSQAQWISLQCFWRHQFTQSLGKSHSPTAKDLGKFTILIYLGVCSVVCSCVCLIELGICKVNFLQQTLPSLVLEGKVENQTHREFSAPVQRQKAHECWPVADLDIAFQPAIAYAALRSKLQLDADLSALIHGEKDANSLLWGVLSWLVGFLIAEPTLNSTFFAPLHCTDRILVLLLNGLMYYPCSVMRQA